MLRIVIKMDTFSLTGTGEGTDRNAVPILGNFTKFTNAQQH